jgi:acetate kinase
MSTAILIINAGSSSVKFRLFSHADGLPLLAGGKIADIGNHPVFSVRDEASGRVESQPLSQTFSHEDAFQLIFSWLAKTQSAYPVDLVGHRVVHGGAEFTRPAVVTPDVLERLRTLSPLAPLHQPHNLAAIEIIGRQQPRLRQMACFDTAFHAGIGALHSAYALPQEWREKGFRRYGFHGLSYAWIAHVLREDYPDLGEGRIIAAHLGNGASLCAMENGHSVDTTMGMTALDGLPMGTRCGSIDPGAVLAMLESAPRRKIESILYEESGLKGLSGKTNDVKALLANPEEASRFAIDYFVLKAAQFAGQMAVSLGGVDALVFTGGIGENAAPIRDAIAARLAFLGPFRTLVIPANEERMMALQIA